jgi:hypothetical protein
MHLVRAAVCVQQDVHLRCFHNQIGQCSVYQTWTCTKQVRLFDFRFRETCVPVHRLQQPHAALEPEKNQSVICMQHVPRYGYPNNLFFWSVCAAMAMGL